jgi:hypothetical protein
MAKPEPDPTGDFDEHYRDLAALRRLANEREGLERDSAEWIEYARREEVLTRRIRSGPVGPTKPDDQEPECPTGPYHVF